MNTGKKAPWFTWYLLLLCSHCHLSTFCHSAHSVPPLCAEFLNADVRPVLVNLAVLLSPIGNNMFHSCIPRQRFRDVSPTARWRHFPKRLQMKGWGKIRSGCLGLKETNSLCHFIGSNIFFKRCTSQMEFKHASVLAWGERNDHFAAGCKVYIIKLRYWISMCTSINTIDLSRQTSTP